MLRRLGISAATGAGAAVSVAILVALLDLYVTGHGHGSIIREIITRPSAGVHPSVGDLIFFATGDRSWPVCAGLRDSMLYAFLMA